MSAGNAKQEISLTWPYSVILFKYDYLKKNLCVNEGDECKTLFMYATKTEKE